MKTIAHFISLLSFMFLVSQASEAKIQITVEYSEAANYFDLMDNVSNWWEGFTEPAYLKEWEKRNGANTSEDQQFFAKYKALREKFYDDLDQHEKDPHKNRNGFFSMLSSTTADPIAEAFYSSRTMTEAYRKLEAKLSQDEIAFLQNFYDRFQGRARSFMTESESFRSILPQVRKSLTGAKIDRYFSQVSSFYNVKPALEYRVIFVWWPSMKRTNASPTGNFLVMRYNPVDDLKIAASDSDIAFHEVVHVISNHQPLEQKKALTEAFLKTCDVGDRLKKLTILEEPLAVVFGQILFLEKFNPIKLKLDQSLYSNPWISVYAKLLHPIAEDFLKSQKTINDDFISSAAKVCNELVQAAAKVMPQKAELKTK
jgi:hypothetical protein